MPFGDRAELHGRFAARFRELFGYAPPPRTLELVSIEAKATAPRARDAAPTRTEARVAAPSPVSRMLSDGAWVDARVVAPGQVENGGQVFAAPEASGTQARIAVRPERVALGTTGGLPCTLRDVIFRGARPEDTRAL